MRVPAWIRVGLVVLLAAASCRGDGDSDSEGANAMPPLSPGLQAQQDFYRFEFLPDGYPGRDDGWAHPLYGVYVLNDYLDQHEASPSAALEEGLRTVAHAALERMEDYRDASVFWYEADPARGARLYRRHYSGLTQGYYAEVLYRVGDRLDDPELTAAADRVFESLLIPVEEGGVLHNTTHGPVIAEVPQQPNSWILNGWQSSLASVHRYSELSDSDEARQLFTASSSAMAKVLPLYDVRDLSNSRYGLTGFTYLRINPTGADVSLSETRVVVPDEQPVPVEPVEGTRWQSYFLDSDTDADGSRVVLEESSARLNVVLSLASAPAPNRLEFRFDAPRPMELAIDIQLGSYDPLSSAPVDAEWVEVDTVRAVPGEQVSVEIPIEMVEKVANPTNFIKKIAGERTNVYHSIHIQRLRQLVELGANPALADWADRWEGYICEWSRMPTYDGLFARSLSGANAVQDPAELC